MKILFYLEPHPIRNRFESFNFIGMRIMRMLRDEYIGKTSVGYEPHEVRILLSRHYDKIIKEFPEMQPAILGMSAEENNKLTAMKLDWQNNPKAIADWVDLMKGAGEVSEFYESVLERVQNGPYSFDLVINWATNGAIRNYCEKHGIHNISLEQGCVRNPIYESMYIDAMGVNGMAMSRYIDLSRVVPMDMEVLRLMLPSKSTHDKAIDAIHNTIKSKYSAAIYEGIGRNVLIALQLKDDSNCILYSDYASMHEMLSEVLPVLHDAGYKCFIKPHPAAKDRLINQFDHDDCKTYLNSFENNVYWLDDIVQNRDYIALLNKMDWIVTVNSSAGFEAMIYGKPVVILGDAPYRIGKQLPRLEDMLSDEFDYNAYSDTCARIVTVMLRHYLVPSTMAHDFSYLMRYIDKATRAYDILQTNGASAMTDFIQGDVHLDFAIKQQLTTERVLQSRYAKYRDKLSPPTNLVDTPKPITVISNEKKLEQRSFKQSFSRKWAKLKRDPAKFCIDSKNPLLRYIGRLMGGRK